MCVCVYMYMYDLCMTSTIMCTRTHIFVDRHYNVSPCQYGGGYTVPSEVEQHFDGRRNAEVGPGDEVELRHRARFVRLQVLQVEASNQVFVAPNMLGHEVHLVGEKKREGGV